MFRLFRSLSKRRRPNKVDNAERRAAPKSSAVGKARPEWETVLLDSFEQNNLAPAEEVILHAFDLYQEELYGPITERRLLLANLYAEIVADVAALRARVPALIERARARHAFEFSRITEQQEHPNGRIS